MASGGNAGSGPGCAVWALGPPGGDVSQAEGCEVLDPGREHGLGRDIWLSFIPLPGPRCLRWGGLWIEDASGERGSSPRAGVWGES